MFQRLREDIACIRERDPAARSTWEVLTCYPGLHAIVLHRQAAWWLAARLPLDGALRLAPRALPHRHRDPSRRDDRPARLHRPRHGRRRRRDRRDRRRLHDLPGRDARRHVADARAPSAIRRSAAASSSAPTRRCSAASRSATARASARARSCVKPVPPGATAVGNPARIIQAEADATREATAAKMGFSAYGLTQGDDPVSQAMKGLIDNASGHEHQIALLWQAIEKLSARSRELPSEDCVPRRGAHHRDLRRRAAEPAGEVSRRGRQARRSAPERRLRPERLADRGVGLDVRAADQVDAVGHGGEDARAPAASRRGRPSSVSAIAFGWPGRLMISALPRITATWRDRIAVGTKRQADPPHLLAEAGHLLVGDGQRRLGRDVARRRAGAAGGEHQVAARVVDQLAQGRARSSPARRGSGASPSRSG